MNSFEFATAGRIVFGAGRLKELPRLIDPGVIRILVVTGSSLERAHPVLQYIADAGGAVETFQVLGEPTIKCAEEGARCARAFDAQLVVGLGGGSVIDAAKAIAALTRNAGPVIEYLEVIGAGKPLSNDPLPFIAIPTTSGTGAEVTRNAVLLSEEHRVKVSLRSPKMLPTIALVDPQTTLGLPPETTATTGMDALTQLIEPFLSCRANPMTDAICREALPRVARSLEKAFMDGSDLDARTDLSFGSLSSGLALANSGLGAVHGFAAPIGGMFSVPHGAVCAALLPAVLQMNLQKLEKNPGGGGFLARLAELAAILTGDDGAAPQAAIQWVAELKARLGIKDLKTLGITVKDHGLIATKAASASSMKGNPVALTHLELIEVLGRS